MLDERQDKFSISTWVVFILVGAMPLAVATGFSSFERSRQALLVIGAGLAIVSWGIGLWRWRGVQARGTGPAFLGGCFLLMVAASVTWTSLPALGALSVLSWVSLGVIFLVLIAPVGKKVDFSTFATALSVGTLGAGILGVYDLAGGQLLRQVWDPPGYVGGFEGLYFGTAYYLMALPLVGALFALASGLRRWLALGAFILGALHLALLIDGVSLIIFVTASVGVALGTGVVRGFRAGGAARRVLVAISAALIAGALGFGLLERPAKETDAVDLPRLAPEAGYELEQARDEQVRWPYFATDRIVAPVDLRFRPYLNAVTRGMWEKEPVIGHGAGGWWANQTDVVHTKDAVVSKLFYHYPAFTTPHSDLNRVLVEQGGLGFALFLLWLISIGIAGARLLRGQESREGGEESVRNWALLTALGAGFGLIFYVPLLELAVTGVVWVGVAALVINSAAKKAEKSPWYGKMQWLDGRGPIGAIGVAIICAALGTAMIVPASLNARASLERGYADHLMLRSHFDQAAEHFIAAHRIYPAYPEALYNAALANSYSGTYDLSAPIVEEALRLRPYDSRILTQAAVFALRADRVSTALELGREALRTGPNHLRAYDVYTAALQRRARYADSARVLEAALNREPPRRDRARLLTRLGRLYEGQLGKPEKALELLTEALQLTTHGLERELLSGRVNELEKRLEREKLQRQGLPIPPHLMPEPEHHH